MQKNRGFNTLTIFLFIAAVFAILFSCVYTEAISEYHANVLNLAGIYIIVALSLNLITGFTGQLALGQAGFMAVGAYTTIIVITRANIPMAGALIVGGLVAAVFGIIIGFPTLRLRGDYLAITTLGFGEIIRVLIENFDSITGGASGLKHKVYYSKDILMNYRIEFVWIFAVVVLTIIAISNLIKSSQGRAILSIREDEIAANSMGINVAYYKMFSFTIAAFIAGVGGGLFALHQHLLEPKMSGFMNSVNYLVILVLGGMGSITGTVLAGILFTFAQEFLRVFGDWRLVIFGLILILLMLFWQKGIMGTKEFSIVGTARKIFKFGGTGNRREGRSL